jgi:cytosine/adenosine deaminase-related metal-dependent hydrolase
MASKRLLLRGGHVITMDPNIGTLPIADILIEDDRIMAVEAHIDADAEVIDLHGQIVAPGLIDTHRHTWQTQMRSICADWTLTDYILGIRLAISPVYEPNDVFIGNRLGSLEAINAGVTTILDFSHCNNTPEHADAALTGLRDAGIRAIFGYGFFESNPGQPPHFSTHTDRLRDFDRIANSALLSGAPRVRLGAALAELGLTTLENVGAEVAAARERNVIQVAHTACLWAAPSGVREMYDAGLLGPDQVHVHCNTADEADWGLLARTGAKLSISVETELNMGMGRPVFAAAERHGIKPTLSADVISLNSGDLFAQLRMAVAFKRWADAESTNLAGGDPQALSVTAHDALKWSTVNAADALGMSDLIGSITPGKQADIIAVGGGSFAQHPVLDAAGTLIFQTTAHDVTTVIVAGTPLKRNGTLVGVDVPLALREAEVSASAVLERARALNPVLPARPLGGLSTVAVGTQLSQ